MITRTGRRLRFSHCPAIVTRADVGASPTFRSARRVPSLTVPPKRDSCGKRSLLGSKTLADLGRASGAVSTSRGGRPLIDLTELPLGGRLGHPGHRLTTPPIAMVVRIARLLAGSPEPRRFVRGTDPSRPDGWRRGHDRHAADGSSTANPQSTTGKEPLP